MLILAYTLRGLSYPSMLGCIDAEGVLAQNRTILPIRAMTSFKTRLVYFKNSMSI